MRCQFVNTHMTNLQTFKHKLIPWTFLLPVLFMFSIYVLWPIVESIWISLHEWDGIGAKIWVGFENYKQLFSTDFRLLTSLKNNAYWLILMLLSPLCGLALALFLNQQVAGIRLVKSLFFFPFVINLVVVGLLFSWFYNPKFGLLAYILSFFGVEKGIPVLADEKLATFGIIFAALWPQISYCMILYLTGLSSLDRNIIEAGQTDGARGWSMLYHIILPQLRPATFIALVVTIIGALRSFDLIAIMTAGGPWGSSYVLAYQMYQESIFNYRMGYGAAIAVVLFIIMDVYIAYFLTRVLKREK